VIGPGRDYQDYAGDWANAREIGEAGCILVRPDQFVAYRHPTAATDAKARLTEALSHVLGKPIAAACESVGASNSRRSDW
jgi:2,4-dichlorophenol 6-monooxygenase